MATCNFELCVIIVSFEMHFLFPFVVNFVQCYLNDRLSNEINYPFLGIYMILDTSLEDVMAVYSRSDFDLEILMITNCEFFWSSQSKELQSILEHITIAWYGVDHRNH